MVHRQHLRRQARGICPRLRRRGPEKCVEAVEDARMSMEAVARRAGVGKAALYRRWDSKDAKLSSPLVSRIAPDFLAESPRNPALSAALREVIATPRRENADAMLSPCGRPR